MPPLTRPVVSSRTAPPAPPQPPMVEIQGLSLHYGAKQALDNVSLDIPPNHVTAFIGPSGCGKSTLLRCLNRMNDLVDGVRVSGRITIHGQDVNDPTMNVTELRKRVGMVFQKSNPFPKTIFDNVAYGPRILGLIPRGALGERVEQSLRGAALWDEVKDRLHDSALGPIATAKIEDLMLQLKERFTIVIVTHNMQQAARVSDFTAFMYVGRLIEYGRTQEIFTTPREKQTEDYITGRFG